MSERKARLPLSFKPRTIRKYEKEHGSILDNLDIDVDSLIKVIQAGNGNCPEETAEGILETFLENGGDVVEALMQIMEALQRGGFLPRDLALGTVMRGQMKAKMNKLIGELTEEE